MKRILVVIVLNLMTFQGYSQCFNNQNDVKEKIVGKEFFVSETSEAVFTSSNFELKSSGTTLFSTKYEKLSYNKKKDRGTVVVSIGKTTNEYEIACKDGYYVLYLYKNGEESTFPEKNSPLAKTLSKEETIKTPTNDRSSSTSSSVKTIKIGTQIWTKQNLNTSEFNNGDPIMEARTNSEWVSANEEKTPAWCYYANNSKYSNKYGKLYNLYAVNDPRGLAPEGYHVAYQSDWEKLGEFLGGSNAKRMKSTESGVGWISKQYCDNSSDFSAFPGGGRSLNGTFVGSGFNPTSQWARFWTGTKLGTDLDYFEGKWWTVVLENRSTKINTNYKLPAGCGFSVRCVKYEN